MLLNVYRQLSFSRNCVFAVASETSIKTKFSIPHGFSILFAELHAFHVIFIFILLRSNYSFLVLFALSPSTPQTKPIHITTDIPSAQSCSDSSTNSPCIFLRKWMLTKTARKAFHQSCLLSLRTFALSIQKPFTVNNSSGTFSRFNHLYNCSNLKLVLIKWQYSST